MGSGRGRFQRARAVETQMESFIQPFQHTSSELLVQCWCSELFEEVKVKRADLMRRGEGDLAWEGEAGQGGR